MDKFKDFMKKQTLKFKKSAVDYGQSKKDNVVIKYKNVKENWFVWPPKIHFKENVQKFAGGMMTAIILLVIVGFFVGIGTGFSQITTKGSFMNGVWSSFNMIGFKIMGFLPLWFAIGLSFSIAKGEKGYAAMNALFALIGIYGMIALIGSKDFTNDVPKDINKDVLWTEFLGMKTYNTGIFLGIIVGVWSGWLHNRSYKKELPSAFSFFGGSKWTITKTAFYIIPFGAAFYYIWPLINSGIVSIGEGIGKAGLGGTFLFGALDKALLPLGLHHLIAFPVEYTAVGGTEVVSGVPLVSIESWSDIGPHVLVGDVMTTTISVDGVRNIINMQAASLTASGYIVHNFTSGRILFQIGGYMGIALALIFTSLKENRGKIASIVIPAAITAAFVGISEPIEYTFLFVAPLLYFVIHIPLAGLAYVLTEVTNVSINGHALFFMIPNLTQPDKVQAMSLLYLIPSYLVLYFASFYFAIKIFNFNTPGRTSSSEEMKLFSKKDYKDKKASKKADSEAKQDLTSDIIKALGGKDNIISVENCATRLRVSVKNGEKVKDKGFWMQELKAVGVVQRKGSNAFQIIYGPKVTTIATNVREKLNFN